VERRKWHRHAEKIARGVLQRWQGEAEPAEPDRAENNKNEVPAAAEDEPDDFDPSSRFAIQLTELVANNKITVTGAEAVLKVTHDSVDPFLQPGCDFELPTSWYKCRKLAVDGCEPEWFTRDFCPKCDYLFPDSSRCRRSRCPECDTERFDRRGKPHRQAYYFSIDDKVKRLFGARYTADLLNHGAVPHDTRSFTQREQADCWDGELLQVVCARCVLSCYVRRTI
jgi:hypothetical protein